MGHAKRKVWDKSLPEFLKDVHLLNLFKTTPPPITEHLARTPDGRFWLIHWNTNDALYQWSEVSPEHARQIAEPVKDYHAQAWLEVFEERGSTPPTPLSPAQVSVAPLAVRELLTYAGLPDSALNALKIRLGRFRPNNNDCYVTVESKRMNKATYLYYPDKVHPVLDDLKATLGATLEKIS